MAEDFKKRGISHNISIENRNKIMITGVTDVLSFDEEGVIAPSSVMADDYITKSLALFNDTDKTMVTDLITYIVNSKN